MKKTPACGDLAINGGPKSVTTPDTAPRRFDGNELRYLKEALEQNTLFYGYGRFVKAACRKMAAYTGRPHIVPCSSGSAAVHLGLIACGIGPGDEVVCTPNTDAGTVLGILAEGAVPVFCDTDITLQPTVATIAARRTRRTRAVVVVHLAGYPAPADEIAAWCEKHGIGMVEDCAQSWGTRLHGRIVGSFGTAGAFSTNDFKHLSTGDGGFVALADEELYRRVSNYADKHYDRLFDQSRRMRHLGLNYRMSELQGAVALAQLERVKAITVHYHKLGERLHRRVGNLTGAMLIPRIEGAYATYWWSCILTSPQALTADRKTLIAALQAEGVPASSYGRYDLVQSDLFRKRVVRPWLKGGRARYPFEQPDGRAYTYDYDALPTHRSLLDSAIMLHGFGPGATLERMDEIAFGIRKVFAAYARPRG